MILNEGLSKFVQIILIWPIYANKCVGKLQV